jgi:hypothetical protein
MPAGSTYTPIQTTTLGSDQATIENTSIPGTYTDLILTGRISSTDCTYNRAIRLQFNSDTSSLYSTTNIYGESSSVLSTNSPNSTFIGLCETPLGSNFLTLKVQINNYKNTTTNKTTLSSGGSANIITAAVGLYRSTSAITSIKLFLSGMSFRAGSSVTIHGILAA